jgi:U3 small nucleolar RNA-associated protein 14
MHPSLSHCYNSLSILYFILLPYIILITCLLPFPFYSTPRYKTINITGSVDANQLTLADLISGLGEGSTKLGPARKTLERLEKKAAPISAPLPGPIRQRQERKAGYESAKKEATKWVPMVKAHREAPTLVFTSDKSGVPKVASTTAALAANHKPETDMEAEIAAILEAAGAGTAQAVTEAEEALALNTLTAEEAAERRNKLAKMRALLFYHELKAKRMKKIKSKEYRRKIKKAEKRRALGLGGESGDADFDEETLRHELEDAEFDRAKERLTLKHKNTSRWAKHALQRGALADEDTRQALNEQLRLGIELRSRVDRLARPRGEGSDDDDDGSTSASEDGGFDSDVDSSSDDGDGDGGRESRRTRKLRAAAKNILQDGDGDGGEDLPEKGLLALPFMKRALDKRKKEAQVEAQEILDTLDHGANGTGDALAKDATGGRMSFSGPKSQSDAARLAQRVQQLEEEASHMDSDEDEDAEAKVQRLNRQLAAGEGRVLATATGNVLGAAPDQPIMMKKHNNNSSDGPHLTTETNGPVTVSGIKRKSVEESGHLFAGANGNKKNAKGKGPTTNGRVSIGPAAGAADNNEDDAEVPPPFIAVPSFQGAKDGYVFQKGSEGIGYYRDKFLTGSETKKTKKKNSNSDGRSDVNGANIKKKKSKGLTQEELVKRAFAGDDVVSDFAAVKAAEIDQQLPKDDIPAVLPGWGSWSANQRKEPAWLTAAKHKAEARKKAAVASRKDAKLKDVIISEKWDKKASAYKTASVPFPFDTRDMYERSMRQPLGRDFNSDASFRDLTRPAVIKDAGVIIEPARFSQATADHSVKESKARVKPSVKVIAGGMSKRSKKAKG